MREDSTEFAEDVVSQEFRRGFRIGDRLLRPAMVKVSSGPGPAASTPDLPVDEALANE
jgi:molecular chaperone GrpE